MLERLGIVQFNTHFTGEETAAQDGTVGKSEGFFLFSELRQWVPYVHFTKAIGTLSPTLYLHMHPRTLKS